MKPDMALVGSDRSRASLAADVVYAGVRRPQFGEKGSDAAIKLHELRSGRNRARRSMLRCNADPAANSCIDQLRAMHASPSKPDTDRRERTVEGNILRFACIQTDIHRVEEHIRAIAEADFRIGIAERKSREAAEIGYDDGAALGSMTRVRGQCGRYSVLIFPRSRKVMITACGLMMRLGLLPPEQCRCVCAPIDRDFRVRRPSHYRCRSVPRNRRADAVETGRSLCRGKVVMIIVHRGSRRSEKCSGHETDTRTVVKFCLRLFAQAREADAHSELRCAFAAEHAKAHILARLEVGNEMAFGFGCARERVAAGR